MLAASAQAPFDSERHLFEIKWDGIRCLAFIEAGAVRLQSRHLTDITTQFPELACLGQLPGGTILDGELVVLQDGKPFLTVIQHRVMLQDRRRILLSSQRMPAAYMVFDLLYLKDRPLVGEPLSIRRQALQTIIGHSPLPGVLLSQGMLTFGCSLFGQVVHLGLEGVMAKSLNGRYLPGKRCRTWLKIKPKISPQVLLAASAMSTAI